MIVMHFFRNAMAAALLLVNASLHNKFLVCAKGAKALVFRSHTHVGKDCKNLSTAAFLSTYSVRIRYIYEREFSRTVASGILFRDLSEKLLRNPQK